MSSLPPVPLPVPGPNNLRRSSLALGLRCAMRQPSSKLKPASLTYPPWASSSSCRSGIQSPIPGISVLFRLSCWHTDPAEPLALLPPAQPHTFCSQPVRSPLVTSGQAGGLREGWSERKGGDQAFSRGTLDLTPHPSLLQGVVGGKGPREAALSCLSTCPSACLPAAAQPYLHPGPPPALCTCPRPGHPAGDGLCAPPRRPL